MPSTTSSSDTSETYRPAPPFTLYLLDGAVSEPRGTRHLTSYEIVFFIALLATALALGGVLAHALELPNKVGLSRGEYFIVQKAYRGWDPLAYLLAVQLMFIVAVAVMSRRGPRVLWRTIFAVLFLLSAQAVFWIFTYPTNVTTANWTTIAENWETLRRHWEYSHAVGAAFQVFAMISLITAAIARARR